MPEKSPVTWEKIARRIRVPVGFAFSAIYIGLAHPTAKSILSGAGLVASGIMIRALASGHLSKNEQLATTGLYSYTRNPLYLGSLILALGFTIAARSGWVAAISGAIFALIYIPVIKAEEEFLRTKFAEFENYKRRVPRFIPRLTSRGAGSAFSWGLYLKHREYNAALGAAVLIAALLAKLFWFAHPQR